MLHYVHQPVANLVCLLFGVSAQLVFKSFFFFTKIRLMLLEMTLMREMRVNQNSKIAGTETKTMG